MKSDFHGPQRMNLNDFYFFVLSAKADILTLHTEMCLQR